MEDKDMHVLYYNRLGIGFLWNNISVKNKIQLVFRDMNLEFDKYELEQFRKLIKTTNSNYSKCQTCKNPELCRNILLVTPLKGLNLVVSTIELEAIYDLVEGTLFNLNLENLLDDIIL